MLLKCGLQMIAILSALDVLKEWKEASLIDNQSPLHQSLCSMIGMKVFTTNDMISHAGHNVHHNESPWLSHAGSCYHMKNGAGSAWGISYILIIRSTQGDSFLKQTMVLWTTWRRVSFFWA